jgi:predicted nucleic acid-binding protein
MTTYFFDSSGLVKRYVDEPGSDWVHRVFADRVAHTVFITEVTLVEVASALSRRQRIGSITLAQREHYESLFLADLKGRDIIPLDMTITTSAMLCCYRFGLRAYDAVQLATALAVQQQLRSGGLPPLTFVSSDQDLLAAAATPEYDLHPINPSLLP